MPSRPAYFQLDQFSIMPFDGFSFKLQLAAHRCLAVCMRQGDSEARDHPIRTSGLGSSGVLMVA